MRAIKLGIGSYCYPYAIGVSGFMPERRMTAFDLVDKAAELEVQVVQIADNCPLDALSVEDLERLRDHAEERGIALEVGTRGIQAENLERYAAIAERLHASLLRVVIDAPGFQPSFDQCVALLRGVLPRLENAGIVLGIENHDRFPTSVFASLVDKLDSPRAGIVLDTVNSFACEENTQQVMDALSRYTVNFHVKDFKICRVPNAMGLLVTGTVAGKGFLHIPEMLRRLGREAKTDLSAILEMWMQPEKRIEDTIVKEEQWVRESVAYLKQALNETH